MNPITRMIERFKALFRKSALESADILTDGVVSLFEEAHEALEKANELYGQAVDEIDDELAELSEYWQSRIEEKSSVLAGVAANNRRKDKLAEFLG